MVASLIRLCTYCPSRQCLFRQKQISTKQWEANCAAVHRVVLKQSVSLKNQVLLSVKNFNPKSATYTAEELGTISQGFQQLAQRIGDLDEAVVPMLC
jgi:hypothetical protein